MPSSARSRRSRSRICACVVTSRPVVGSSSTISSGSQASAIAITTRCCWPPESWCGYLRAVRSGSGRRTCAISSRARRARSRARAADVVHRHRLGQLVADAQPGRQRRRRVLRDEADASPAHLLQLAARQVREVAPAEVRSRRSGCGCRAAGSRAATSAVVVLPQPDSPTSPSASPRAIENVASLTTLFQRSFDQKSIVRPCDGDQRILAPAGAQLRVLGGSWRPLRRAAERAGDAVGDEVEADHEHARARPTARAPSAARSTSAARFSLIIRPHSGEGGRAPKPRNPSELIRIGAYPARTPNSTSKHAGGVRRQLAPHDRRHRLAARAGHGDVVARDEVDRHRAGHARDARRVDEDDDADQEQRAARRLRSRRPRSRAAPARAAEC